jgi:hypothetical protein
MFSFSEDQRLWSLKNNFTQVCKMPFGMGLASESGKHVEIGSIVFGVLSEECTTNIPGLMTR